MEYRAEILNGGLVLLAAFAFAGGAVSAETWDTKRALKLATELEETLDRALHEAEKVPQQKTVMQQRNRDSAVQEMREVYASSRDLVTKLRIGWGREDTRLRFSNVRIAYDRAMESASDAVVQPAIAPLLADVEKLLLELQKLYG